MSNLRSPLLTQRFSSALEFASVVHSTQVRKGTSIPYLAHLLAVASLVIEHGGDEDTAIAALLHDAAEDCGGLPMLAQVRARFGEEVATVVSGCSDTFEEQKPDYAQRKTQYVEHLVESATPAACLVSAADKLHNGRSILHDLRSAKVPAEFWRRFTGSPREIGWYYGRVERALDGRLAASDGHQMVTEIRHVLDDIAAIPGCDEFVSGLQIGRAGGPFPAAVGAAAGGN